MPDLQTQHENGNANIPSSSCLFKVTGWSWHHWSESLCNTWSRRIFLENQKVYTKSAVPQCSGYSVGSEPWSISALDTAQTSLKVWKMWLGLVLKLHCVLANIKRNGEWGKKKTAHYSLCQSWWWRRWLMQLGFLNKQLLSTWCSPLPLHLARVDSQRFVFAAPLRPAPSSIAPFHGPFSTTICCRPHGNNPLKTTGLQSTTAWQWIAPLSRILSAAQDHFYGLYLIMLFGRWAGLRLGGVGGLHGGRMWA